MKEQRIVRLKRQHDSAAAQRLRAAIKEKKKKKKALQLPPSTPTTKEKTSTKQTAASSSSSSKKRKSVWKSASKSFQSVLSIPFLAWNDMEMLFARTCKEWSPNHRSYIVQHLIRFLELKVLMEEFADTPVLAPTPLIGRAWKELVLSRGLREEEEDSEHQEQPPPSFHRSNHLYTQTLNTIQEFHGRPLTSSLVFEVTFQDFYNPTGKKKRSSHQEKELIVHQRRVDRTQHLFQTYYGEAMLTELQDSDDDQGTVTDTSTITDYYVLRSSAGTNHRTGPKLPQGIAAAAAVAARQRIPGKPSKTFLGGCWNPICFDALTDIILLGRKKDHQVSGTAKKAKDKDGDSSTVLVDDLEASQEDLMSQQEESTDSLFTFEFLNTRHVLCRNTCRSSSFSSYTPSWKVW